MIIVSVLRLSCFCLTFRSSRYDLGASFLLLTSSSVLFTHLTPFPFLIRLNSRARTLPKECPRLRFRASLPSELHDCCLGCLAGIIRPAHETALGDVPNAVLARELDELNGVAVIGLIPHELAADHRYNRAKLADAALAGAQLPSACRTIENP